MQLLPDSSRTKLSKSKNGSVLNPGTPQDASLLCEKTEVIKAIIAEAIEVGAPTYNQGNHLGCYRIYEGAAYKIIYKYGTYCKEVKSVLETALEKSYGDYSALERAWIMRMAFDRILGEPTITR
jgi:hypothetical protein